jgi:antibiotic biosynthesis monooxygenase (ABM) superfamily enzyme
MSTPVVLVATVKVRAGSESAFTAWKAKHDQALGKIAGYAGGDLIPPTHPGGHEWTLLLNFRSREDLVAWQNSQARADVLAEAGEIFEGGSYQEMEKPGAPAEQQQGSVTEVIFSKIVPGREDDYRAWSARMEAEQAKYAGYRGMFLQPPDEAGGMWTSIIRFDSAPQLEKWMNAPERAAMLKESKEFIEHEQLTHLATSFPGWVPIDPATGEGPPNWKAAMLVLLGLFPIVMLEMKFLGYLLGPLGVENRSLGTFIGNFISVALTSFITMPLFVRWFGWWLFPKEDKTATAKGVAILCVLFVIEVAALWKLLP